MVQVYDPQQYREEKAVGLRAPSGAAHLTKLSGKHLRIIALHCAGLKGGLIAREMNMTGARISNILNDPLVREMIQKRFVELDNEMFAKSVEVVSETLEQSTDRALALRAADMVWRANGRYAEKPSVNASAEDIVSKMLTIARQHGSAELSVRAGVAPSSDPVLTIEGSNE